MTCGEATIRLLERYGVDTVFGIPGVHTLDFCRGLDKGGVRHIQARNEQGAGFMADGYARVTGKPGVALVISGPGVTNAATAIGQAYADSSPVLLLSAEAASYTIGKGWGVLHEVTEQKAVTAPLTALSATAYKPEDVPELMAQAFSIFSSERPRPVHISIPTDVQAMPGNEDWQAVVLPARPRHDPASIKAAADLLLGASNPLILVGGGAAAASQSITSIAESLGAIVISSTAGKGVVADDHPLNMGGSTVRPEVQKFIPTADVVLAIGTEIAETDSFVERLDIHGKLVRIDIDPRKMNDQYPADIPIVSDAEPAAAALLGALVDVLGDTPGEGERITRRKNAERVVRTMAQAITEALTPTEAQHVKLLQALREVIPDTSILVGDACQLVYTGAFAMPVSRPRQWHYPAGYCALGCALPNAVGAKLALPDAPIIVMAGDGGAMFTIQELICAAELGMGLPIIIWENGGLKQIQDDMRSREIPLVGVEGINPDFGMLAASCHCHAVTADSIAGFQQAVTKAFDADRPTVITVREDSEWLL
jgi:thiamine pyrophosphate-dependent acetolactate synthase large subunit-like protein